MRAAERGFLLLSSHLGDESRKPLTAPQLRNLAHRIQMQERPVQDRQLEQRDLLCLGYGGEMAERILTLLSQERQLDAYLKSAAACDCYPITRVSEHYPLILRKRMGLDAPGCLWVKGDVSLLSRPAVALVGSRDLMAQNRSFAQEVGRQAARQGYVLVSGNARGADRTAQESCLKAGGAVISVVADELYKQPRRERMLYVSEDGFAESFSAVRALSRNHVIHAMGLKTFVAQCSLKKGGTWSGTAKNLQSGWSDVFAYRDGSEASFALEQLGANLIGMKELNSFYDLQSRQKNLFE